jgi:flagellar motor switch protein FliM
MAHPRDLRDARSLPEAVEWDANAAEDAVRRSGAGRVDTGLLEQDEIDSLLGVSRGGDARPSGLQALVDNNTVSYERLPMLEVVFDRLVRILTASLRNFTSENVELTLESISSLRFGDYLQGVPLPVMIAVFRAVQWDNFGLLTVSSALIYSMVDVLLGGRRGGPPTWPESRPFTSIERALIERLIRLVLADMATAFAPLSAIEFRYERLETNPRFAAIARPTNGAVLFRLRIEIDDRGGPLEILIPYATLEPVRDLLLQMFMGEKFGRDSIWESHLARQMLVTTVELEALLEERAIPLGEVMALQVGTTLALSAKPDTPIIIRCGHVPLLRGRVGRVADHVAIQIEDKIRRDEAPR